MLIELGQFFLDVLAGMGGGRGNPDNELTRFSLGMISWGFMALSAWTVREQTAHARDSLLFIGFLIGFGREVFMFVIHALQLHGLVSAEVSQLFSPPIEHTFLLIARTVIAGAYIQYLLNSARLARTYICVGFLGATALYVVTATNWWSVSTHSGVVRFNDFWGEWLFHSLGIIMGVAAIVLFLRDASWLRKVICIALLFYITDDALMLVNILTDHNYQTTLNPIRNNLHIWASLLLGYIYWRERYEVHERLREQLRQTERINTLGQLAAGVAHDFNTHLQVILGYAQLEKTQKNNNNKDFHLEQIINAASSSGSLVNQLLVFSQDRQSMEQKPVNLNDVIAHISPMSNRLLGPDIQTKYKLQAELPPIYADPHMMEQVLMNLLINARDALSGNGEIIVETLAIAADPAIHKTANAQMGYVQLNVHDNGKGIECELQERIFEPFFTTKTSSEGTGLGLALVKKIVLAHHGHIRLESTVAHGTTMRIDFPVIDAIPEKKPVESPYDDASSPGNAVVLVVDSTKEVRELTVTMLKAWGYRPIEAVDGEEGLKILTETDVEIQLLIISVNLANMNGYETFVQMQASHSHIPVLFIAGTSQPYDMAYRSKPHIAKPFSQSQLLKKVRSILNEHLSK